MQSSLERMFINMKVNWSKVSFWEIRDFHENVHSSQISIFLGQIQGEKSITLLSAGLPYLVYRLKIPTLTAGKVSSWKPKAKELYQIHIRVPNETMTTYERESNVVKCRTNKSKQR